MIGVALLSGGALTGAARPLPAATSSTLDVLDRAGDTPDTVDLGRVTPITPPPAREAAKPQPSGNPLWSIPLSVLSATRQRPIFSASRRPPPQAVAGPVPQVIVPPPPPPAEPERLTLALIGAVVGDNDAIAVFLDRTNQKIMRLRQGDSHAGWLLSSVQGREVTLKKDDRTEVLALQRQDEVAGLAGNPPSGSVLPGLGPTVPGVLPGLAPVLPGLASTVPGVGPPTGVGNATYAPFTPRSTPKNGESDGL